MHFLSAVFLLLLLSLPFQIGPLSAQDEHEGPHIIQPGDSWTSLAIRIGIPAATLINTFGVINPQQQPVIGSPVWLNESPTGKGQLLRPVAGGLLETAARDGQSHWKLASQNNLRHPYAPLLYTPVLLPGGDMPPLELPEGIENLIISDAPAKPGRAIAIKARSSSNIMIEISLDGEPWHVNKNDDRLIAIGATGAFFEARIPQLQIEVDDYPLWSQPLLFEDESWNYDQVSFADTPANEKEEIRLEKERLQEIWANVSPEPLWQFAFQWPLREYVELTSHYGARRSVNGGPYDTYHEGTDFSAYGGTPVYSPADGRVVLADSLTVRGRAVILDHGLGIHTGYYHLSDIKVKPGDQIYAGDILGEVGTTGRSTGNHLHWDLLVGTIWVDPEAWMKGNLSEWVLDSWGDRKGTLGQRSMPPFP